MNDFGKRLKDAFDNVTNAEIARLLGVSEPAVKNYVGGRVPDADKLRLIADLTNCNLHWLLTGYGEKFISVNNDYLDDEIDFTDEEIAEIEENETRVSPNEKLFVSFFEDVVKDIIRETVPQIVRNEIELANGNKLSKNSQIISGGQEISPKSKKGILIKKEVEKRKKAG